MKKKKKKTTTMTKKKSEKENARDEEYLFAGAKVYSGMPTLAVHGLTLLIDSQDGERNFLSVSLLQQRYLPLLHTCSDLHPLNPSNAPATAPATY